MQKWRDLDLGADSHRAGFYPDADGWPRCHAGVPTWQSFTADALHPFDRRGMPRAARERRSPRHGADARRRLGGFQEARAGSSDAPRQRGQTEVAVLAGTRRRLAGGDILHGMASATR